MFWLHLFQNFTASRRWCCRWCDEFFHPGWRKLGLVHCVFHPDILVSIDRMFILTESPTWETFVLLRRFLNTQGQTLSFRDCQLVHTLNHLWQVLVVDFWGSGNSEVFGLSRDMVITGKVMKNHRIPRRPFHRRKLTGFAGDVGIVSHRCVWGSILLGNQRHNHQYCWMNFRVVRPGR